MRKHLNLFSPEARDSRQPEKIQDKTYSEKEHLENLEYESKSKRKLNQ